MIYADVEFKENMSEEEIGRVENCLENAGKLMQILHAGSAKWEKNGIDLSQIDSFAKMKIGDIGPHAWLERRKEIVGKFNNQFLEAKKILETAKQNLMTKEA